MNFSFLLKWGLKKVPKPKFSFFSILRGRALRGWMTNSGNERDFYSALFDTYVGFQIVCKSGVQIRFQPFYKVCVSGPMRGRWRMGNFQ